MDGNSRERSGGRLTSLQLCGRGFGRRMSATMLQWPCDVNHESSTWHTYDKYDMRHMMIWHAWHDAQFSCLRVHACRDRRLQLLSHLVYSGLLSVTHSLTDWMTTKKPLSCLLENISFPFLQTKIDSMSVYICTYRLHDRMCQQQPQMPYDQLNGIATKSRKKSGR